MSSAREVAERCRELHRQLMDADADEFRSRIARIGQEAHMVTHVNELVVKLERINATTKELLVSVESLALSVDEAGS